MTSAPSRHSRFAVLSFALRPALLLCAFVLASSARADDENLALGNPSGALVPTTPTATDPQASTPGLDFDNVLLEKTEFALSYNRKNGGPNWVSWHLAQADRGRSGRADNFRPDETLPPEWAIRPTDYRASGYDRGHQCPSGDRTSSPEANSVTFLMSNMLPQAPSLNRGMWAKFEDYCRDQLKGGENEEYIICGGVGSKERIGGGKVNVPASCWKVAVLLPTGAADVARIDAGTRVVAILIPNDGAALEGKTWRDFLVSVDRVEEATGYDFLSNVPKPLQEIIEAKVDSGRAPSRSQSSTATDSN